MPRCVSRLRTGVCTQVATCARGKCVTHGYHFSHLWLFESSIQMLFPVSKQRSGPSPGAARSDTATAPCARQHRPQTQMGTSACVDCPGRPPGETLGGGRGASILGVRERCASTVSAPVTPPPRYSWTPSHLGQPAARSSLASQLPASPQPRATPWPV